MGIALGGRSARGLRYIDNDGVEWVILLAYLDGEVVWDGRISETVQVPRARSFAAAHVPVIGAPSDVLVPVALSYSEAIVPQLVSGGVLIDPPTAVSTSQAYAPVLHNQHVVDVLTAVSTSEAHVPVIRTIYGITPPVAVSTSQAHAPTVFADALVVVPVAASYSAAHVPNVGAVATVAVPTAVSTSTAHVPSVSGGVRIVVPRATSTSAAYAPTLRADAAVTIPRASSTSQAYAPTVTGGGFPRQRMNKDGAWNGWAGQGTTWATVTGWVSDATYPAVIVSNQLQVSSELNTATVTGTVTGAAPYGGTFEARLLRNGTQIGATATVGANTQTITWTGAVVDGDLLRIEARGGPSGGGSSMGHTITGGSINVAA